MSRLVTVALAAWLLVGCYGTSSSPTPGDMVDVLGELSAHGVTMTDTIAGDAGCSDPTLADNARKLQVLFTPDQRTYAVYLFRWRNNADYVAAGPAFEGCAVGYGTDHPGSAVDKVDISPWRAFGPDWTADLRAAVAGALTDAAGGE